MKSLKQIVSATTIATMAFSASAQTSISLGYGSSKVVHANLIHSTAHASYLIGASIQPSDATGSEVDTRKSNYGTTKTGSGSKYTTLDLGFGKPITEKSRVLIIATVGQKESYTNYSDNRFTGGGYHMIDNTKAIGGGGILFQYDITKNFGLGLGANTIHGISATVHFGF